jgi:hypothetical protein
VCFAHGGGAFPSTVGRIQHGWAVRPDLCAVDTKLSPLDHLGRFWADSLVHDADALDAVVRVFGEDRVCLGSDYPFPLGEYTAESMGTEYAAGELIDAMGVDDAGGNEEDADCWPGEEEKEKDCAAAGAAEGEAPDGAGPRPPRHPDTRPDVLSAPWERFVFCAHRTSSSSSAAAAGGGGGGDELAGGLGDAGKRLLYSASGGRGSANAAAGAGLDGGCGCCGSGAGRRPRAGWTRERRRRVLGANAMDWLGKRYEDFVRK